jgi:lysophospholipase L1-like esterase
MVLKKVEPCIALSLILILFSFDLQALTPNPIISRNKPTYGSPASGTSNLVNGKFGDPWNVSSGSWVAINLGGTYSRILVNWNNPGYTWSDSIASATSCKNSLSIPIDYDFLKSSNSTNGTDGTWTVALSVKNNTVSARAHPIDFSGSQWVKMSITKGGGSLDEIEVFDITNGSDDVWFFPGTSISANSFKSTPPAKSFADLIHESHPTFLPAIIRGGIPCINSTTMANDISKYLAVMHNAKYWAIEMGTNDAWGGTNSNVAAYKTNMQKIIDSCKTNGIQPIISRIIGTDSTKAKWQVHPDFLKVIDSLTTKNKLIPGPDLFTYFSNHKTELDDGVHPTATGGASVFRLWAEKMDSLYSVTVSNGKSVARAIRTISNGIALTNNSGSRYISTKYNGTLTIYSVRGTLLEKRSVSLGDVYSINNHNGILIIRLSTLAGIETIKVPSM